MVMVSPIAPMHPGRQMLDGTIRVFLAEALLPLTGLITAAFLTRRLGPEGYGLLTLAATVVVWVEGSIGSLLSRATIKLVGGTHEWKSLGATVMRSYVCVGSGAALLLWLLANPIATLLQEPTLAGYLGLFALDIPLHSLAQAHQNILVGIGAFRQRAFMSACRWIIRLLFIVILVELGLSIEGAILGSVGASLAELMVGRFYVRPPLFRGSALGARQLLADAIPLFLFALSLMLCHRLDLLMLKVLGGTAAHAGIYGAAQNLSIVPSIFALSFSPLLLSTLSRTLRAGNESGAREMSRDAMRVVIGLLPFAGMTAGAAPEIVALIFGPIFLPAAPLLAFLIFGALAMVMISVAAAILTAAGKPGWTFALTGPLVPLAITGHLLLIPRWGAIGASLVTTLFAGLGALATVSAVYRIWRILPPAATLFRSVLVCGFAYVLAALWPAPGLLLLLKLLVIGLVIPLAYLLLGEFSACEIALARAMFRWRMASGQSPREV
jgi:O-antigen/teichoic acid export membrane protein